MCEFIYIHLYIYLYIYIYIYTYRPKKYALDKKLTNHEIHNLRRNHEINIVIDCGIFAEQTHLYAIITKNIVLCSFFKRNSTELNFCKIKGCSHTRTKTIYGVNLWEKF